VSKPIPQKTSILPRVKGKSKQTKQIKFDEIIPASEQKGISGTQSDPSNPVSLLTGENLNLKHNNMVPFYKGELKQNRMDNSTAGILERFTGKLDTPTIKKEVKSFFDGNRENIYGTPLFTNEISRDRFYQSGIKNNVSPTPQIRVKPLPEEVVRPIFKPVDQLRAKTNPKNTYEGRIVDGQSQAATQRGIQANVNRNLPERHFKLDSDRYFTGSSINREAARDNFDNIQDTNRSNEQFYTAPAKDLVARNPFELKREGSLDPFTTISSEPLKHNFLNDPVRNFDGSGEAVTDYGKCSFIAPPNERDTTSTQHVLNVSDSKLGNYLYNADDAKTTQKELNVYEYTGNIETVHPKHSDYSSDYNIQKIRQTVDDIDYRRHAQSEVKNLTNRNQYQNYKSSLKENTLDQNNYKPGPQYQSKTNGSDTVQLSHCKTTNNFNNYQSNSNSTYNTFNNDCGQTTTNNLKCIVEKDNTERIGPEFIKSLENNPYELRRKFN
jgi:hypothetical protein